MSGALGELGAVFREPIDRDRVSAVLGLLGREVEPFEIPSHEEVARARKLIDRLCARSVALSAGQGAGAGQDGLDRSGHDLPTASVGLGGWVNLGFREGAVGVQHHLLQLGQLAIGHFGHPLGEQHRQHAGDGLDLRGVGFFRRHVCALRPELAQLVARGPIHSDRNRKSIFTTRGEGHGSRTAFAIILAALDALYRALEWAGDQVADFGGRFSRGVR